MKIRFINPTLHGLLDYAAAATLVVLPFVLNLGAYGTIEQWLSVAGGFSLILYSLITDYAFSAARLVSFRTHLILDLAAAAAFLAAPVVFGFAGLPAGYYIAMAIGVVLVVALSNSNAAENADRPATAAPASS